MGLRIEGLIAFAAVLGLTAFVVVKLVSPKPSGALGASFRILVTPREALSMQACVAEARRVADYGVLGARPLCMTGRDRQWYSALITNSGSEGGSPLCHAVGFDASAKRVFEGLLLRELLSVTGPYVRPHSSIAVDWYLPHLVKHPIATYLANCDVNENKGF